MVFFRVGFAAKFASSAFDSNAAFNKEPSLNVKFRFMFLNKQKNENKRFNW